MRHVCAVAVVWSCVAGMTPALADDLATLKQQSLSGEMSPRRKALKQLVALGTPQAAEALVAAASAAEKRGDTVGVNDVSFTLKSVTSPAMAPVLRAAVPQAPKGVKSALVAALGRLNDAESVPMLRELSKQEEDKRLAREAYLALAAATRDASDVERFIADLKDRKTESQATDALGRLSSATLVPKVLPLLRDAAVPDRTVVAVLRSLGRMASPESAVALLDVVDRDERAGVRSEAAKALVSVAEPTHVARMEKLLVDKKRGEIKEAYLAADRRQNWTSMKQLVAQKSNVVVTLLYEVASAAHPSDEPLAMVALASKDDSVRRGGIEILGHLDSATAESTLCKELKNSRNASYVREDSANGLSSFATDTSITCLIETMEAEKNAPERHRKTYFGNNTWEACVKALRRITGESMEEDPGAWRTWHEGGLKSGVQGMIGGLTHKEATVRALAATRLLQSKERNKAVDALITAVANERNPEARTAMVKVLGAIRDPKAKEVLVTVLESKGSRMLEEHVALGRALDDLGDGRGTAALVELLDSEKAEERAMAARALSEITGEPLHHDGAKWRAWWKANAERYRR